jgi:SAM-dependent methyltransferase
MSGRWRELVRSWVLPFVDPRQIASLVYLPRFFGELSHYRRLANGQQVRLGDTYPCLADRMPRTPFDPHYFFQGAWLSRRLRDTKAEQHVDVGSSVIMLSVLSAQLPIVFVDYRPLRVALPGLTCVGGDLAQLPFAGGSVASLSCLHVVEHVGLGRYGDSINPQGSEQAMRELARVVRPGGHLFLSTPVGRERVCFNAHRVFDPRKIAQAFPGMHCLEFSVVDDAGAFHERVDPAQYADLAYGCGMYMLVKPQ